MSNRYYHPNLSPLPETAFHFLPLGSVKPQGWLTNQLKIQANGQTGILSKFWESLDMTKSDWLGKGGENWERGPYYLDGLVPLSVLLEDEKLLAEMREWIEWILNSQDDLGHFGPKTLDDWWPFGVILKVLTQYQEATGDPRVIPLMERFFKYMKNQLPHRRLYVWAKFRWADNVLSIIWLYNRNGDPELLELADSIMHQGYDWAYHFADFPFTQKQAHSFGMPTHVVNNAMGVKTPGIQYLLTGWEEIEEWSEKVVPILDQYHGTAVGLFTGDEHLAGKDPTQGTELCAVVEYMFSLENMLQIFGDPAYGDRIEKIAYNALPGTFSADMKQHQYDQQANQVLCTLARRHWTNNFDNSNIFGLEPNYGCCTANQHQGWPKLASSLWMATPEEGLAAVIYAPCEVKGTVRGGQEIGIDVVTEYPWDEKIAIALSLDKPADFSLEFRIPAWADGATVEVNGETEDAIPGTFHVVERLWSSGDRIVLNFPMAVKTERRFNDSVTISRGPIVYSLKIGEKWEIFREDPNVPDYAVYPTTPWNYGLVIDPENPQVEVVKKGVGEMIFSPDTAPIELKVKGRRIPEWVMVDEQAGPLPPSPVKSDQPIEELTLIPYGCAKLRITEFPLLEG